MITYEAAYGFPVEIACVVLSHRDRVVEIGCGTDVVTLGAAPGVKGVTGTDIAPETIEVALERAETRAMKNVDFRIGDGYRYLSMPLHSTACRNSTRSTSSRS